MPDDLYRTDIVTWSRLQADRLRRHLAGERVNDLDWEHVIEEIEGLGNSEIAAVTALLTQAMLHALKVARWPTSTAVLHSTGEAATFLVQAQRRYPQHGRAHRGRGLLRRCPAHRACHARRESRRAGPEPYRPGP